MGRHAFVVALSPRVAPTAPMKNYLPVCGGQSRKPAGQKLDAFVVGINGHPAVATFCDAFKPEGSSIHRVTHPSVSYASNCTYVAGTTLRYFFDTPIKDGDNILHEPPASFKVPSQRCRNLVAATLSWVVSAAPKRNGSWHADMVQRLTEVVAAKDKGYSPLSAGTAIPLFVYLCKGEEEEAVSAWARWSCKGSSHVANSDGPAIRVVDGRTILDHVLGHSRRPKSWVFSGGEVAEVFRPPTADFSKPRTLRITADGSSLSAGDRPVGAKARTCATRSSATAPAPGKRACSTYAGSQACHLCQTSHACETYY